MDGKGKGKKGVRAVERNKFCAGLVDGFGGERKKCCGGAMTGTGF